MCFFSVGYLYVTGINIFSLRIWSIRHACVFLCYILICDRHGFFFSRRPQRTGHTYVLLCVVLIYAMHVCFFSGTVEYRTHICFTRLDVHMSQASVVFFCFFVSHWNYGLWDSPVFLSVRFILSSGVRFIFSRGHCSMRHMYFALWNINKLQASFFSHWNCVVWDTSVLLYGI